MWPDDYYRELGGIKRKELLDHHLSEMKTASAKSGHGEEGIAEDDRLRAQIWQARYASGRDQSGEIDYFMKAWTDLSLTAKNAGTREEKRRRAVLEAARTLLLDRMSGTKSDPDDRDKRLIMAEYEHLFHMLIYLYRSDYGFTHHVLGIGKLSPDALEDKIRERIGKVTITLPGYVGLEELFAPLAAAAGKVCDESFGDYA